MRTLRSLPLRAELSFRYLGSRVALTLLMAVFSLHTATTATAQSPLPDSFNPGVGGFVYSLAVQPDGKIVVGGSFTNLAGHPRIGIGRLNPDGTLDPTLDPGVDGWVSAIALQADGKIVVGGGFTNLGAYTRRRIGRLNPDGTVDATFDPGAVGQPFASIRCLALQEDGRILVGGDFTNLAGERRWGIGRLDPDGTLDRTFDPGADSDVLSLALQPDGKILVGGSGGASGTGIRRLNPDGTVDVTFHPGQNYSVHCLAVQADGKILAGGDFTGLGGQPRNLIGRLHPDGTLDATFDPRFGLVDWDWYFVFSLALQADGKILVGGYFSSLGLVRLNPNGTLDPGYDLGMNEWTVKSLAVQADGKVLAGGAFTALGGQPRNNLGRLDSTGPATQILSYDGSTVTWMRGGSSPEVWRTTFESSTDGTNWTLLGSGTRISGGWKRTGVSLAPTAVVRARGYVAGGGSSSGWYVESILETAEPIRLSLLRDGSTVVLNWTGGRGPYQVQQTTDVSRTGAWQNVGPTTHTNSVALPLGPTGLFLRVRGQ